MADAALAELSTTFDAMYRDGGRPSIPPERLLKAGLLMAFYSVRSERLFCEQLDYNLLFRWFLDMDIVEPSFDHSTLSRNRERLMNHEVGARFFGMVLEQAKGARLMSDEHFTVDGTLLEAWASMKSFRRKDEDDDGDGSAGGGKSNRWVDFKGEKRSNETHESKTDPEARLARKGYGKESKLCFGQHVLMENRSALIKDVLVTLATGTAEREAALAMIDRSVPGARRITLGADKGYDTAGFVQACRERNITPHVAQNVGRSGGSAIDGRTASSEGYTVSQRIRMRIEEIFGWTKSAANFRKTRYRGVRRNQFVAFLVAAAYNLLRMAKLCPVE
jgi:transposase